MEKAARYQKIYLESKMQQYQNKSASQTRGIYLEQYLQNLGIKHVEFLKKYLRIQEALDIKNENAKSVKEKKLKDIKENEGGGCCSIITSAFIGMFVGAFIDFSIMNNESPFFFLLFPLIFGVGFVIICKLNYALAKHDAHVRYKSTIRKNEKMAKSDEQPDRNQLQSSINSFQTKIEPLIKQIRPLGHSWGNGLWNEWSIPEEPIGIIRLGELHPGDGTNGDVTALFPFPHDVGLLYLMDENSREKSTQSLQSSLLRALASVPAGKLKITFIDPLGLGQNAAIFMPLGDYDEGLITNRVWSESRHIDQRLIELTEHIETVIQKYLRTEFKTIDDYNEKAGEVAEAYRALVIFDFPVNFNEESVRRLLSIVQNGPRCGVYTMMTVDARRLLEWQGRYGQILSFEELERRVIVIDSIDEAIINYGSLRDCLFSLDQVPSLSLSSHIVKLIGQAAQESNKVEVPFDRILPSKIEYWSSSSIEGLSIPIGPSGARRMQFLTLGEGTAQHVLVVGRTGSGKSTLLNVIITSLSLTYSPREVQLYLIDFKKGVEFKPYASKKIPHASVIAVESEREFGLSVLQGLDGELTRRGDLFRSAQVDSLTNFRRRTEQALPRILLLVDEFQEFFTEDDMIAQNASSILDRLVRQGRAFGIHVLLGSQSLAGAYSLARSTIDQMAIRIALQCSETDSRLILAEDNAAARSLSRPGEAIYNNMNGMIEGNQPFQIAYLEDSERNFWLEKIQQLSIQLEVHTEPIVFEGNTPALIEKNRPFQKLIHASQSFETTRNASIWLGEPLTIAEPNTAYFRFQSGANMLIVGQNTGFAASIISLSLIALSFQFSVENVQFYFLDYSMVDSPEADLFQDTIDTMSNYHSVSYGKRRKTEEYINCIAKEIQARDTLDDRDISKKTRIFLFIYGLQRARDLRQDEDYSISNFSYELDEHDRAQIDPAKQFQDILRDGPELGVHTLVWCDTVTNLNRSIERRTQREFEMRIAFQMSADDSTNLIDTPIANRIGPFRAIYTNDEEGRQEKFRPYGTPSPDWLKQLKERYID